MAFVANSNLSFVEYFPVKVTDFKCPSTSNFFLIHPPKRWLRCEQSLGVTLLADVVSRVVDSVGD